MADGKNKQKLKTYEVSLDYVSLDYIYGKNIFYTKGINKREALKSMVTHSSDFKMLSDTELRKFNVEIKRIK